MAHVVPNILPENLVIQRSIPIYGITQLGLRSHPTGSSTLSFIRSDKPVFNTVAFRPCYPTQAVAGPIVSHIRNPYLTFPGGVHHFHGHLDPGRGRPHGDSQIAVVWTRSERELHINVLELRAVILALYHWATVLQGRHVLIATDNNTVVAYINKQGGTHSNLLLRLVVDLFLWLQTQDITPRARHIPVCLNVIADRLSRPNQPIMKEWNLHPEVMNLIFRLWGTPVVDMFVKVHNTHLQQFICL